MPFEQCAGGTKFCENVLFGHFISSAKRGVRLIEIGRARFKFRRTANGLERLKTPAYKARASAAGRPNPAAAWRDPQGLR